VSNQPPPCTQQQELIKQVPPSFLRAPVPIAFLASAIDQFAFSVRALCELLRYLERSLCAANRGHR